MHYEIQQLRLQGLGYKRIARQLGISENTVKSFIKRNPLPTSKVCMNCGKEITDTPHKRKKKFCCDKCRLQWWNKHPELISRRAIYAFECPWCGNSFESYGNKNRIFCSRKCHSESRRKGVFDNG